MSASLELLLSTLACEHCQATNWVAEPHAVVCRTCGAEHTLRDGIVWIDSELDADTQQERDSVPATGTNPLVGGWRESIGPSGEIHPDLLAAYLSLPYSDGSFRFQEPGYFTNVHRFAAEFDFVRSELQTRVPGGRLLDLGADGTWSTARLAAQGFSCVALDITDHLRMARLYQQAGPPYALVNGDMHAPMFRDGAFDAITAFNVLHHSSRLPWLAANIARMLRPGGHLGIVEPYIHNETQRAAFGAAQSELGINENIHALEHWYQVFADAGLALTVYFLSGSFNAILVKGPPTIRFEDGFGEGFYRSDLVAAPSAATVAAGQRCTFAVTIHNHGFAGWATREPNPIAVSYHLSRHTPSGPQAYRFENARTSLPSCLYPGKRQTVEIAIEFAEAGTYEVEFDLVHEARTWFKERGGGTATARVVVGG